MSDHQHSIAKPQPEHDSQHHASEQGGFEASSQPTNAFTLLPFDQQTRMIQSFQKTQGNAFVQRWLQRDDGDFDAVGFRQTARAQMVGGPLLHGAQRAIRNRFAGVVNPNHEALRRNYRPHVHIMSDSDFDNFVMQGMSERNETVDPAVAAQVQGEQRGGTVGLRQTGNSYQMRVTLVHELLHAISGLSDSDNFTEAMTQYLALYAVDGRVERTNVYRVGLYDFQTLMLVQLMDTLSLTPHALAQAYFQGNLSAITGIINRIYGNNGWTVIRALFNQQIPNIAIHPDVRALYGAEVLPFYSALMRGSIYINYGQRPPRIDRA